MGPAPTTGKLFTLLDDSGRCALDVNSGGFNSALEALQVIIYITGTTQSLSKPIPNRLPPHGS